MAEINDRYFHDQVPAWNEFMAHGTYDEYWTRQVVLRDLGGISHPILNVAGWFDAEDFYGPMSIYEVLEQYDTEDVNFLVAGPWRHGGWARSDGQTLGSLDFGSNTSAYYREQIQARFFAYYLKDEGTWDIAEAQMVVGNVVISIDYFKRFLAGLRMLFGGRVSSYESLLDRARREAMLRMKEDAFERGYNAVINVRIETSRLASSSRKGEGTAGVEILAFGTAVKFAK